MTKTIRILSLMLALAGFTNLYAQEAQAPAADAAVQEDAPMGGEIGATDALPPAEKESLIKEVEKAVADSAVKVEEKAAEALKEVEQTATDAVEAVEEKAVEVAEEVKEDSEGAFGWIKGKVMWVFDGVKNGVMSAWDWVMGLFK